MRNQARNIAWAALVLAALLAWDVAVMTAGPVPGLETKRLSAQEGEVRSAVDEERMFMVARRALNREEFDLAAELFQALREKYPVSSEYVAGDVKLGRFVPDSYYWEAFGRFREGNLDEALLLLDLVRVYREAQYYREGSTWRGGRLYEDVRNLRIRIQTRLAQQGDPGAAEEVLRDAERVLAVDTAMRAMRRQYEAQIQEAEAQLEAERQRGRRAVEDAIDRYRVQVDSANLATMQAYQAEQYQASVEAFRALQFRGDSLLPVPDSVVIYDSRNFPNVWTAGNREYPIVVSPDGSVVQLHSWGRYDPILAGIDIHPECVDALTQQQALVSLLRLEVDAMPTVRDILNRDDECSAHLRYLSVNWLGGEKTDEGRDLLTEVAREHSDARTRQWAVTRLANFQSPDVAEVLVDFLRESDDSEMQDAIIHGLYRQQGDAATQALIEFASNGSNEPMPRQRAAVLVAERLAEGSLWPVFDRLDSDIVKRAYLGVVGARVETGELGVASWLLPVVVDGEEPENVRSAALQAWSRHPSLDLEQVKSTYRMLESAEMRDQFLYALYQKAESDDENADAVIDTMIELARRETDPEVRERAIYWLGRTESERAATFLQEILRKGSGWPTRPAN